MYGVVGNFNAQGKVMVASVGVGSIRVTGACANGDLLKATEMVQQKHSLMIL